MKNLQKKVKKYLIQRGWDNLHPADVAKSIVIESAELLEIFQWDNTRNKKKVDPDQLDKVKNELADVLIYCFDMGIMLKLDLEKIVNTKLDKVKEKYPTKLFNKKNALTNDADKIYKTIKQSHRKNHNK